jgi:hypothetical protein
MADDPAISVPFSWPFQNRRPCGTREETAKARLFHKI